MGQTLLKLSESKLPGKPIFNNRMVVEICEAVHVHYRNLRIILSLNDWKEFAKGMADSLSRWEYRGKVEPKEGTHIELCRKQVASEPLHDDSVKINLNKNLYNLNEGKIFAEGAELNDAKYIHLKIRDLRVELTLDEFNKLANCVKEAEEKICALTE